MTLLSNVRLGKKLAVATLAMVATLSTVVVVSLGTMGRIKSADDDEQWQVIKKTIDETD